jgi:hypothetical protein
MHVWGVKYTGYKFEILCGFYGFLGCCESLLGSCLPQ